MSAQQTNTRRKPTAEQYDLLSQWRVGALDKMPYMASMLFSLQLVDAPGLGTFACDDKHRLYIDFDAITAEPNTWNQDMCSQALLHECGHLFGDHRARAKDHGVPTFKHDKWNIATDAEINDDLEEAGCAELAAMGITPRRIGMPDHLTAEEYFAAVDEKQRQQQGSPGDGSLQGDGSGQPQGGDGDDDGDDSPFAGCGSASGGRPAPCEVGDGDGGSDFGGTGSFAPGVTETEKKMAQVATAASIRDHAAKGRGTIPGGIMARAEQVLAPPKVPWRQILASTVKRAVAKKIGDFDADPTRRSRKRHNATLADGRRVFYPGTYTPKPSIAVVRDTSGSMGIDELNRVTSEVDGISRQAGVRGRDLRILDVDADVHEVHDYTGVKALENISGRGGTDMCVGITAANELRPKPAVTVVISDGMTPWPDTPSRTALVICLVGPMAEAVKNDTPGWATTVVVEEN